MHKSHKSSGPLTYFKSFKNPHLPLDIVDLWVKRTMWSHVSAFFTPCSLLIFSKFHQNSIKFECIFELFAQWKTRFVLSKKVFKNCIFHWFWALFRNFCKTEKFSQVQKCLRIFTVAPCKYTGDHRQIMGRSWAVSRIVQNYAQIVPNPYIITSAESALEYHKNPGFEP